MQVGVGAGKSFHQKKNVDITGRMCYNTMNHNVDYYAYMRIFYEQSRREVSE